MNSKVILCVEDNMQVQVFNKQLLEAKGFIVRLAMTLAEAWEVMSREMPALIILDIRLPDGSGLDFLRELRKTSTVPVIALTSDNEEIDIINGLASGCDDYVPKPYTFPVLYARIEALLRRAGRMSDTIIKGLLTLNPLTGQALLSGKDLGLPKKAFQLLLFLAQNEGKELSAEYVYEKVWNTPLHEDKGALKNQMSILRTRLYEENCGYTVRNIYGKGYCFEKV